MLHYLFTFVGAFSRAKLEWGVVALGPPETEIKSTYFISTFTSLK
jgi:hypothetical protein